jgi:hypothetical protein
MPAANASITTEHPAPYTNRVSKYGAYRRNAVNSIAITLAPVTVGAPIHKNALALLGGVASKCLEFREGAVPTAPVYSTRACQPSMKTI